MSLFDPTNHLIADKKQKQNSGLLREDDSMFRSVVGSMLRRNSFAGERRKYFQVRDKIS